MKGPQGDEKKAFKRAWVTILLNLALLAFLIFIAKPLILSMGQTKNPDDLIVLSEDAAKIPNTSVTIPIRKSEGALRVLFIGDLSAVITGAADPVTPILARVAVRLSGKTLDFVRLDAPFYTPADLSRLIPVASILSPDLVVLTAATQKEMNEKDKNAAVESLRTALTASPVGVLLIAAAPAEGENGAGTFKTLAKESVEKLASAGKTVYLGFYPREGAAEESRADDLAEKIAGLLN